jgi:hypothetical protein
MTGLNKSKAKMLDMPGGVLPFYEHLKAIIVW